MLLTGLLFAQVALLLLVAWAMVKMRRGQVLRILAVILHRQMPLESTLAALSRVRSAASEEKLIRKVVVNMSRGADLPLALSLSNVVTPQQAAVLSVAARHGVADTLMERMADQATKLDRRVAVSEISLVYPLVIGISLIMSSSFLYVFIFPKFEQMIKEMDVTLPYFNDAVNAGMVLIYAMFIWGALAVSLQTPICGRFFWRWVPWFKQHFRLGEQAEFARNLSLVLGSGATLEEALGAITEAEATGPFRGEIRDINEALKRGEPAAEAFQAAAWRPEFLWGMESVANGVPPGPCLEQVAMVLEDKGRARLERIHSFCMPVATLLTAGGVGLLAYSVFNGIYAMLRGMMG